MLFATPELSSEEREVIARIDAVRRNLSYILSAPRRWDGLIRRDALARAIRGSNTIEGYHVTVDDAAAAVDNDEPLEASDASWAAVTCYRDALTYILRLEGDPHFEYNEALIRSLHYIMMKHDVSKRPGQWRSGPVQIVDERKGEVVYLGPDGDDVPSLMHELVEGLRRQDETMPVMVRAAMAHLNLAMVHPFSDGNGRMARALQTLVLTQDGIVSPVFSSIEEYLGRHQHEYYAVLAEVGAGAWRPERDARPWVRFCLTAHYRCANDLVRRTKEFELAWNEIEMLRKRLGLPDRVEGALVMAAFGRRLRNSTYRTAAGVSDQVASRDLKRLSDCGLVVPKGERRGRVYERSESLAVLREKARQPRKDDDPFDLLAE